MTQIANNNKSTLDSILVENISQYEKLRPPYPITITVDDLVRKNYKNRQALKTVNSFFIYRKAMVKQNEIETNKCDMPKLSKIASIFWKKEPDHVKDEYKRLAKDAQNLFAKQINLQSERRPSISTINPNNNKRIPVDARQSFRQTIRYDTIQNNLIRNPNINNDNNNQLTFEQFFANRVDQILHDKIEQFMLNFVSQHKLP
ncbi:9894_t:CDS:1 [Ambispora leptoticha]|uniref:9894_t:CDS:1 n=1 Tax=Ambispora leptoticha TaxID=144679 RepID=A0A9N8V8L1_9GLOM|nr:9894_t:CDS:1 [Ambispora leptoticha]